MTVHLPTAQFPPVLANLVVLAINTAHITVAKKDCTRPFSAGDWRFLTMMSTDRCHNGQSAGATKPQFTFNPVDTTNTGAKVTLNKMCF